MGCQLGWPPSRHKQLIMTNCSKRHLISQMENKCQNVSNKSKENERKITTCLHPASRTCYGYIHYLHYCDVRKQKKLIKHSWKVTTKLKVPKPAARNVDTKAAWANSKPCRPKCPALTQELEPIHMFLTNTDVMKFSFSLYSQAAALN